MPSTKTLTLIVKEKERIEAMTIIKAPKSKFLMDKPTRTLYAPIYSDGTMGTWTTYERAIELMKFFHLTTMIEKEFLAI